MWQITDMPTQRGSSDDFVGWLRHSNGLYVKVQIDGHATQEQAFLIIQQFAGILTPDGLNEMMQAQTSG